MKTFTNTNFDHTDFSACVQRGLYLLNNYKIQMIEEGYEFITDLKAARWAIEQAIINRENDTTMMSAVIDFVESIENREESENGINV